MKLFEVTIDRNPGGWKSDEDPHVLVPAENEDEAIQKVKDGWVEEWKRNDGHTTSTYVKTKTKYPIDCKFYACEILFGDYDIRIEMKQK